MDIFGNFRKIKESQVYYVIDYSATGEGRSFWYAAVPRAATDEERWEAFAASFNETEEFWNYYKPLLYTYETYEELVQVHSFMPDTWLPPTSMHIRWI